MGHGLRAQLVLGYFHPQILNCLQAIFVYIEMIYECVIVLNAGICLLLFVSPHERLQSCSIGFASDE